jgi:transposase-like protein
MDMSCLTIKLCMTEALHDCRRAPIVDYRCRECAAVFNIFPDTVCSKTHYDCSTIVMLLRGFAKGGQHLTNEMDLAYSSVLKRRHRIQEAVQQGERGGLPGRAPKDGLPDPEVEADEMYQNTGKKGNLHRNPILPPEG